MKITTKDVTITGIMLTICIVSQLFKNISVYITGPIVNTCLIITAIYCSIVCGIALSIIIPITSFFISGSPILAAIPAIVPGIMIGNIVIVVGVYLFTKKNKSNKNVVLGMLVGTVAKAVVMGVVISLIIVPMFIPPKMTAKKEMLQMMYSVTQLIVAAIGSVYAFIINTQLKKVM